PLSEPELTDLLRARDWGGVLDISAVNGPNLCVVGGEIVAVETFEREMNARDVSVRRLQTSHAFHTAMMEGAVEPFVESLKDVEIRAPQIPFLSSLTGGWAAKEQVQDPNYWGRQMRN